MFWNHVSYCSQAVYFSISLTHTPLHNSQDTLRRWSDMKYWRMDRDVGCTHSPRNKSQRAKVGQATDSIPVTGPIQTQSPPTEARCVITAFSWEVRHFLWKSNWAYEFPDLCLWLAGVLKTWTITNKFKTKLFQQRTVGGFNSNQVCLLCYLGCS